MKTDLTLAGLIFAFILPVAFYYIDISQGWQYAAQWLLQATLLWSFAWYQTWKRRELNRTHANAPLLNNLGWANRFTLLRGGLIALTGGFLFQIQPSGILGWMPGILYGCAAVLDRLDGFVARKTKQTSLLGAELDMVFDALGLIVAPLVAVGYGKIHWSYLSLSIAYYVFQACLQIRRKRGFAIYPLHPSMLRRALAGFQMGFIALVLFPLFSSHVTLLAGFAFMLPVLAGFIVDWLVMTGRITPAFDRLAKISDLVLLPLLRVAMLVCLPILLFDFTSHTIKPMNSFFIYGILGGTILALLGLAGRVGALIVLLLISWHPQGNSLLIVEAILVWISAWVLLLGTGNFNLWRGDHAWVNRHDAA